MLLITNDEFCFVQRATAKAKTEFFRDYGVAEAPLVGTGHVARMPLIRAPRKILTSWVDNPR
jgi:hypothetical protein